MKLFISSERDLLGDYEFNPFVDVELDYDENMEEVGDKEELKEVEEKEEGEEDREGKTTVESG